VNGMSLSGLSERVCIGLPVCIFKQREIIIHR